MKRLLPAPQDPEAVEVVEVVDAGQARRKAPEEVKADVREATDVGLQLFVGLRRLFLGR